MKKYLFMAVAALATLTACQPGDEPQTIVETREISFAPIANETRATAVDETKTATLQNGFAVWGYVKETAGSGNFVEIFNNTIVKYVDVTNVTTSDFGNVTKVWQPEGGDIKYWAPNSTYWFSALYPQDAANYAFSTTGNTHTQEITGFEITGDGVGTKDIVVAQPASAVLAATHTRPAVGLTFDHMLARVRFAFRNGFADNNVTIEISNVELNGLIAKADATISSVGKATWTKIGDGTTKLDFQDNNDVFTIENKSIGATTETDTVATQYRLFIPTSVEKDAYKLSFDLVVKADGVTVLTKRYTVDNNRGTNDDPAVGLKAVNYENGKSYLFSATINGDLLKEDIYPIQFDVNVTDWASDKYMGDIF